MVGYLIGHIAMAVRHGYEQELAEHIRMCAYDQWHKPEIKERL